MHKTLLASAALIALTGTAFAAGSDSFNVNASIAPTCSIEAPGDATVDLALTGQDQYLGTANYTCNFTGFLTSLQAASLNGSRLVGPEASVAYTFGFDVGTYAETRNTLGAGGDFNTGGNWAAAGDAPTQVGSRGVDLFMYIANSTTIAGNYSDTIYISIAP